MRTEGKEKLVETFLEGKDYSDQEVSQLYACYKEIGNFKRIIDCDRLGLFSSIKDLPFNYGWQRLQGRLYLLLYPSLGDKLVCLSFSIKDIKKLASGETRLPVIEEKKYGAHYNLGLAPLQSFLSQDIFHNEIVPYIDIARMGSYLSPTFFDATSPLFFFRFLLSNYLYQDILMISYLINRKVIKE